MRFRNPRWLLGLLAVLVAGLMAAGCGSSSSDKSSSASSSGSSSTAAAAPADDNLAKVQAEADKLLAPKGEYTDVPAGPKAAKGKNVVLISCDQANATCAAAIDGAETGAKSMGWKTTIVDAKSDAEKAAAGVRQAIVAKADGIYIYFLDCRLMKQSLVEAKKAKIPVVVAEGLDCNDSNDGSESLFTAKVLYNEGDIRGYLGAMGHAQALLAVTKAQGKAKVVNLVETDLLGPTYQQKEESKVFAACKECKEYKVPFTLNDFEKIQEKTQQALLQNPDANTVLVQYDAVLLSGVSAAVKASGRKINIIAGEGEAPTMDLVRSGAVTGGMGLPIEWEGWGGVDMLNRLFNGETKNPGTGLGIQLYDKDHNTPASGAYQAPIDFAAQYKKMWGVG